MSSRRVKARTCPCGSQILTGLDADWLGINTTLDAQPVDQLGEALALLQGRRTYNLRPTGGYNDHGRAMEERNAWRISHPTRRPWPIHAEHRCHSPLPVADQTPTSKTDTPTRTVIIEGAPF